MDIFISWNDEQNILQLPILPEAFEITGAQNNTTVDIYDLGEINLKGNRGLYSISISSFFPAQEYMFRHGDFNDPYEYYCKQIAQLYETNTTVHLVVTGTDINLFCTIESFTHGESGASRDVRYTLAFKEYREKSQNSRVSTKAKEKNHKWKKGDTWPKLCKKYLGTSDTWRNVRKNNKAVVEKALRKNPKKKETIALIGSRVIIK